MWSIMTKWVKTNHRAACKFKLHTFAVMQPLKPLCHIIIFRVQDNIWSDTTILCWFTTFHCGISPTSNMICCWWQWQIMLTTFGERSWKESWSKDVHPLIFTNQWGLWCVFPTTIGMYTHEMSYHIKKMFNNLDEPPDFCT